MHVNNCIEEEEMIKREGAEWNVDKNIKKRTAEIKIEIKQKEVIVRICRCVRGKHKINVFNK